MFMTGYPEGVVYVLALACMRIRVVVNPPHRDGPGRTCMWHTHSHRRGSVAGIPARTNLAVCEPKLKTEGFSVQGLGDSGGISRGGAKAPRPCCVCRVVSAVGGRGPSRAPGWAVGRGLPPGGFRTGGSVTLRAQEHRQSVVLQLGPNPTHPDLKNSLSEA